MKNFETITDLDQVFAPVAKRNVRDLFLNPELIPNSGQEFAVIRENYIYGYVSENFSLVEPSQVNKIFDEYLSGLGFTNTIAKMDKKGNFLIRKIKGAIDKNSEEFKNALATKDLINPAIEIFGSLAGTTSLGGSGIAHRPWCANGATHKEKFFEFKAKNTKGTHSNKIGFSEKLGLDFSLIVPEIEKFLEKFGLIIESQKILQDLEVKEEHILPIFYELTKDTRFPTSKFQDAYDILKQERKDLGYAKTNRFLVYNALNYILEHDSLGLDVTLARDTDQIISSKILDLNVGMAMKNFNQIVREQNEKTGKGRRKILELV